MRLSFAGPVAALLLTSSAIAQNIHLGLNAGVSTSTRPAILPPGSRMTLAATGSITGSYDLNRRWQLGLETGAAKWELVRGQASIFNTTRRMSVLLANPAINISALINYRVNVRDGQVYLGGSVGYIHVVNDGILYTNKLGEVTDYHYKKGKGMAAGIQVGYTKSLSRQFGLNVQMAPKMAFISTRNVTTDQRETYNLVYFPVFVGMRYRIGR